MIRKSRVRKRLISVKLEVNFTYNRHSEHFCILKPFTAMLNWRIIVVDPLFNHLKNTDFSCRNLKLFVFVLLLVAIFIIVILLSSTARLYQLLNYVEMIRAEGFLFYNTFSPKPPTPSNSFALNIFFAV